MRTPENIAWQNMKQRCDNPNNIMWIHYGGRGISYDSKWTSFGIFIADMGPRPDNTFTLERRNNERGYSKENCYWATQLEQQRNTSRNTLTVELVRCIKYAQKTSGLPNRVIARQMSKIIKVSEHTIRAVLQGQVWKGI